jgi:hypothetical protein
MSVWVALAVSAAYLLYLTVSLFREGRRKPSPPPPAVIDLSERLGWRQACPHCGVPQHRWSVVCTYCQSVLRPFVILVPAIALFVYLLRGAFWKAPWPMLLLAASLGIFGWAVLKHGSRKRPRPQDPPTKGAPEQ